MRSMVAETVSMLFDICREVITFHISSLVLSRPVDIKKHEHSERLGYALAVHGLSECFYRNSSVTRIRLSNPRYANSGDSFLKCGDEKR